MNKPDVAFCGVEEPGNGGRYAYIVWRDDNGLWYAAFPDYHASSAIGAGYNHHSYIQEKMRCSTPDAQAMADIINRCQREATVSNLQGSV